MTTTSVIATPLWWLWSVVVGGGGGGNHHSGINTTINLLKPRSLEAKVCNYTDLIVKCIWFLQKFVIFTIPGYNTDHNKNNIRNRYKIMLMNAKSEHASIRLLLKAYMCNANETIPASIFHYHLS